jgi:hypothetical protein
MWPTPNLPQNWVVRSAAAMTTRFAKPVIDSEDEVVANERATVYSGNAYGAGTFEARR